MSDQRSIKKEDAVNKGQVYGAGISGQNSARISVQINNKTASPIVTGSVGGNIENKFKNSFQPYTEKQKQSFAEAALELQTLLEQQASNYCPNFALACSTISAVTSSNSAARAIFSIVRRA